jgi:UDP-N-acetylmuramoyl-L-alanyl-D-glutamate--2,6-diaminopimelate ligase
MTLGELFGLEAKLPEGLSRVPITGLAADSREVKPGYLFAALPGVKTDGTRFIAQALERGAAAILMPRGAKGATNSAAIIEDSDPRRRLALIAARFYGLQPKTAVAVTGTNGKTSVASFVRQLWAGQGFKAASLGTVGVVTPSGTKILKHTTPDPIELHAILAALAKEGVTHLALEASSHGLQQRRVDGVTLAAGAFTNISRDHLDYHASFEDYFAQKLRLFTELLPPGAIAVVDVDSEAGLRVAAVSEARGLKLLSVGRAGKDLRLVSAELDGFGQTLVIEHDGKQYRVRLPLVGAFQASNALVAAGLALATGASAATILPMLASLQGARGRLDLPAPHAEALRSSSTTPTRPMRSPRRSMPCALMSITGCSWFSAAAATATKASGPRWEKLPSPRPILPSSPTIIRAAKILPQSAAKY